jgi:hypothetical protein
VADAPAFVIEPNDCRHVPVRVRDDGGVALDGDRDEHRPGTRTEHADESLCNRGATGQIGDGTEADELGMTVDVWIEHDHELGDVTTSARRDESLHHGSTSADPAVVASVRILRRARLAS